MTTLIVCPECGLARTSNTTTCVCGFTAASQASPLSPEEVRGVRQYRNLYLFYSLFVGMGILEVLSSLFDPPVDWPGTLLGFFILLSACAFWSSVDSDDEVDQPQQGRREFAAIMVSLLVAIGYGVQTGISVDFIAALIMPAPYIYRNHRRIIS